MIVYTKQGQNAPQFDLIAYDAGVWVTPYNNTTEYIDPFDSSVWTWERIIDKTDEILGITQNGLKLLAVNSVAECIALEGSFFYDDTNGLLYVKKYNYNYNLSADRHLTSFALIVAGFASGYNETTKNVFDGVYYRGLITGISGFAKKADPIKLGLIAFDSSGYELADLPGEFRETSGSDSIGVPLWAYYVDNNATELTNDKRIFTAYINGYSHNSESFAGKLIDARLYQNNPTCQHSVSLAEYPDAGDNEDKLIPVAFGDIRRGFMVLVNGSTLNTDDEGAALFLVADPAWYPVRVISNVYDSADDVRNITNIDLINCLVTVTKPAGLSVSDLKDWAWQGEGYDIDGTYNNGLDIARAAFLKLSSVPYISATFDLTNWAAETFKNAQPIGISVSSEKGFVEEILQPISISLQGVFDILGDGRISFASRDITAEVSYIIEKGRQLDIPEKQESSDNMVSELTVDFSPNFPKKEPLTYLHDSDMSFVVATYGINRRDPLSPIKSVLVNRSDATALAVEIMATSKYEENIWTVKKLDFDYNPRYFSIVKFDIGEGDEFNYKYGELLGVTPDLLNETQDFIIRELPGYIDTTPAILLSGTLCSDGTELLTTPCSDGTECITTPCTVTGEG